MNEEYTIFWSPEQQAGLVSNCPFLNIGEAEWHPEGGYHSLVQVLTGHQYEEVLALCTSSQIMGIKPGSNPGGSPTGCA